MQNPSRFDAYLSCADIDRRAADLPEPAWLSISMVTRPDLTLRWLLTVSYCISMYIYGYVKNELKNAEDISYMDSHGLFFKINWFQKHGKSVGKKRLENTLERRNGAQKPKDLCLAALLGHTMPGRVVIGPAVFFLDLMFKGFVIVTNTAT